MQECMAGYPTLYGGEDKPEDEDEVPKEEQKESSQAEESSPQDSKVKT